MKRTLCWLSLLALPVVPYLVWTGKSDSKPGEVASVTGFTLKDTDGKDVALADFKDKKAVVVLFIGTECPLVNLYMPRLKELHEEFSKQEVQIIAIHSNCQDTSEQVAKHAKDHKLPFPVLRDTDHKVADLFKAERTPEAFVVSKEGAVVYRGRIDDQFGIGYQRPQPTRRDLAEALNEHLAGKAVTTARTQVSGCVIGRAKKEEAAGPITYTKHIVPILQKNCLECHRPGQIGPLSLTTYEKTKGWSDTIREVVKEGRMPPWHADSRYGKFSNDRSLSKEDRATLLAWIDQGCPKGDAKDLPPPKQFMGAEGWSIGKPDMVFTMKEEFKVPAQAPKNGIPYKYFLVSTDFEEDKWVQAAEAKPDNKAVVHHIIVYVVEPGQKLLGVRHEDTLGRGLLVATAPGDIPAVYDPGQAKRIPKGAQLLFQMHYTPNGVEGTDRSSVGLIFAKQPPAQIVRTRSVLNNRFAIPAGADNHKVESKSTFDKDAMLVSFMPHMHLRGKSFEYKVVYPDGNSEIILSVPRYDFGWQTYYRLEKPLKMPAGTRVECTAHFDNSDKNLNNPDPTKIVRWGDQTWEEMMIGWLDYYYVDEKPTSP